MFTVAVGFTAKEDEPVHIKYVNIEVPESLKQPILLEVESAVSLQNLGNFKITYYCTCEICCGKDPSDPAYGITKYGTSVEEGVTVAVDPDVIPLGSYLYIEGIGFRVAQDTGSAIQGNRIDVYMNSHQAALEAGVTTNEVYLLEGGQQ